MTTMVRENVDEKGRRLLTEGRLTVERVLWGRIDATCRGDSGEVYRLGYEGGHWHCSCEARGTCSHMKALMLVTVRPTGRKPA